MLPLLLSLSLACSASATSIYLGELIPPINALKLKLDDPAPSDGAFLAPTDWILLKTSLEGSISLCEWAVSVAVSTCLTECDAQRSDDILELDSLRAAVSAYDMQLKSTERENKRLSQSVSRYRWSLVGVTAFSAATLLIIGLYQ
tara:strand:- start:490 stop:924 length:435 start_codon:yes stop_codon:yes gene_type:complete